MPARVGVRLVAGVDDRPIERGLESDLRFEEVRALADLETWGLAGLTDANATGAGDHLPRHEEGRELRHNPVEGCAALQQIVLVGAVGRALAVGVVLVEPDRASQGLCGALRGD